MSNFDETLNISTPENVSFDFQVAGIGSRFIAALADSALIVILQIVVNLPLFFLVQYYLDIEAGDRAFSWLVALIGLIAFAFLWGYYIFFEIAWNGQSPGKRLVGLRVICADGLPITFTESAIRNLVRLIDFMPAFYGVGVVTMFINEQSRRMGDLAASTVVIHDKGEISLDSVGKSQNALKPGPDALESANQLPIERIPLQHIQIAEDYLSRRHELSNARSLGDRILKQFYEFMDEALPEEYPRPHPDNILAAIVYLYYKKEG
jgi:uncharacterized RDD family membrane protein YckC